ITVYLNKYLSCNSLASNGSDFKINGSSVSVQSAIGKGCSTGFEMNQIELTLDAALSPGNYSLEIQKGSDRNTLLDICGVAIPEGNKVDFEKQEILPVAMDSVENIRCAPQTISVVFGGQIQTSSIASDGSD